MIPKADAITGGFSSGADLISSIVAGLLIGLFLDWWLGIGPILVIVGSLTGFGSGFYKLWRHSAILEDQAEERGRGRRTS